MLACKSREALYIAWSFEFIDSITTITTTTTTTHSNFYYYVPNYLMKEYHKLRNSTAAFFH